MDIDIDAEKALIQSHLERENFHAAINLAISAMNACRRQDFQPGVDQFLSVIESIVGIMKERYSNAGTEA